jgi:hypothetical protein
MKRILSLVVLLSMLLHCSSRLGILSYVYKNRQEIAYSVGMISERPIAFCSSDYDGGRDLTIQQHDDGDHLPPAFAQAREINLFCHQIDFALQPSYTFTGHIHSPFIHPAPYPEPPSAIFHPPAVA